MAITIAYFRPAANPRPLVNLWCPRPRCERTPKQGYKRGHRIRPKVYGGAYLAERRKKEVRELSLIESVTMLREIDKTAVTQASIEQRFREQSERWYQETAHLSSPLQKMMHLSYQAIIGMSSESPERKNEIIRLMLQDLKQNRRDWFLALSYLTQENPISPRDCGKPDRMTRSWINWGERQGLI